MTVETYGNNLRVCGGCSAFLLSVDASTSTIYCRKCRSERPAHKVWADGLRPNDVCYLQPGCAKTPHFNRSKHVVLERDGDMLIVQPIGAPEAKVKVHVGNVADHDVTPWRGYSLY